MVDKACKTEPIKKWPVKTAQPAAAASDILWPADPSENEPPITAIGANL